jgi:hypothetical protein
VLSVAGLSVLVYAFNRMTTPVAAMGPELLRISYLGSAVLVAGAAYLMMAVVLVSVHRVVPHSDTGAARARTATLVASPS